MLSGKMGKRGGGGEGKIPHCLGTNLLSLKHPITIQEGGTENLIYQAFHSKIMPAMQAKSPLRHRNDDGCRLHETTASKGRSLKLGSIS